jgi:hypothetical protein
MTCSHSLMVLLKATPTPDNNQVFLFLLLLSPLLFIRDDGREVIGG